MNQNMMKSGDNEMLEEYDFSNGKRGKYVSRFKKGSNVINLNPDVNEIFTDSASANNTLRSIAHIVRNEKDQNLLDRINSANQIASSKEEIDFFEQMKTLHLDLIQPRN